MNFLGPLTNLRNRLLPFRPSTKLRAQICLIVILGCIGNCGASAEDGLAILPAQFVLSGPNSREQVLLEKIQTGKFLGQMINVAFVAKDTNIVSVHGDVVTPLNNGTTQILVSGEKCSVLAEVTVRDMEKPVEWSFRNNVQPVLAKAGC